MAAFFLRVIAVRHHDDGTQAILTGGEGDGLAMVAGGGGDDAPGVRFAAFQLVQVDQPAADLEGADRGVVFMLQPELAAQALLQQRPAQGRGFADVGPDQGLGGFDLGEGGQGFHGGFDGWEHGQKSARVNMPAISPPGPWSGDAAGRP